MGIVRSCEFCKRQSPSVGLGANGDPFLCCYDDSRSIVFGDPQLHIMICVDCSRYLSSRGIVYFFVDMVPHGN